REMNVPVTGIRLGGGGARSPLWRQIQADVYGHAVEIVEAEEGAAYGAAILAGVGAGLWPTVDAACSATVRVASRVNPQPAAVAILNASYSAFRQIYPPPRASSPPAECLGPLLKDFPARFSVVPPIAGQSARKYIPDEL